MSLYQLIYDLCDRGHRYDNDILESLKKLEEQANKLEKEEIACEKIIRNLIKNSLADQEKLRYELEKYKSEKKYFEIEQEVHDLQADNVNIRQELKNYKSANSELKITNEILQNKLNARLM